MNFRNSLSLGIYSFIRKQDLFMGHSWTMGETWMVIQQSHILGTMSKIQIRDLAPGLH